MRLIRILLMVVVVVVLGLVALLVLLPGEKIAKIAADQVRAQTGRELVFEGDVGISWYPVLGVKTGPVRFANADWSEAGPMFRADSAQIGVDAMSLVGGTVRITQIDINRPDVLLEVAKDGRANWDLFPQSAEAGDAAPSTTEGGGAMGGLVLESLAVRDARLRYVDHGGDSFDIKDVDATLQWPDRGGPAEIALTLRPAEEAVDVVGVVDDLEGLLGGEISRLRATVAAAGGKVAFDGRAAMDPQAAGRVEADMPDADAFMAALGLGPAGIAGQASFDGDVTYTKAGELALRDGTATAFGNMVSVEADVALGGAKPVVNARVVGGALSLAALTGGGGGSGGESGAGAGWSKAPIDASGLGAIDGEISIAAESVDLGGAKVGRVRAGVVIDNSRAVITLHEVNAYDGVASGTIVANNRGGLSTSAKLKVTGVEMQKALGEFAGIDKFTGKANATVSVLGSGGSMHAIMNSLSGEGSVDVGQGKILGVDLDRLLRGQPGGGVTVFDSLGATWSMAKGVLSNKDLLLSLPNVLAKGEGTIGIGPRNLDYLFTPQIRNETEDGLAVPVEIKGGWDNPKIVPRLDKAFGRDIEVDLEEKKDAVREELKSKVKEKLGVVETEEGQSTEDAIKQKVEDEVKNKLKSLLGGN